MRMTITEIARMRYCERLPRMDALHGKQRTGYVQRRAAKGIAAHTRFENAGRTDNRCFIATCVYGHQDLGTQALREYRDAVLMKTVIGRLFVRTYYCVAPTIASCLDAGPILRRPARALLDAFLWAIGPNRSTELPLLDLWRHRSLAIKRVMRVGARDFFLQGYNRDEMRFAAIAVVESFPTVIDAAFWISTADDQSLCHLLRLAVIGEFSENCESKDAE